MTIRQEHLDTSINNRFNNRLIMFIDKIDLSNSVEIENQFVTDLYQAMNLRIL